MNQSQIDSCPNIYRPSTLIWWLGMLTLCVLPFMSSWRVGTLSSFYLEAGTLFFALCLIVRGTNLVHLAIYVKLAGWYIVKFLSGSRDVIFCSMLDRINSTDMQNSVFISSCLHRSASTCFFADAAGKSYASYLC